VDTGDYRPEEGTILQTDFGLTETPAPTNGEERQTVYHTIMTGRELTSVGVSPAQFSNQLSIDFTLSAEGARIFAIIPL
jgi:preprotein translocase subunit SecD